MIRASKTTSGRRGWRRFALATIISLAASALAVISLSGGGHAEAPIRITTTVADHSLTKPSRSLGTARRQRQVVADPGCGCPMRERGVSGLSRTEASPTPLVRAAR